MMSKWSKRPSPPPTRTDGIEPGEFEERHPAQGMISVSSLGGSVGRIFGSALAHPPGCIRIQIRDGAVRRHRLGSDWYNAGGNLVVEIDMTHSQWALLLSTPNTSGVPCTIRSCRDGSLEPVPYIGGDPDDNSRTEVAASYRAALAECEKLRAQLNEQRSALRAALEGKVSKKLLEAALGAISATPENALFYVQQVREASEKARDFAVLETESAIAAVAARIGFEQIADVSRLLSGPTGGSPVNGEEG